MNNSLFTVVAIDGQFTHALDPGVNMLFYGGLTWAEATELCRLSFNQGFDCVIWRIAEDEETGESETAQPDQFSTVGDSI